MDCYNKKTTFSFFLFVDHVIYIYRFNTSNLCCKLRRYSCINVGPKKDKNENKNMLLN